MSLTMGPEPYLATCDRCDKHVPKPELPEGIEAFVLYCRYVAAKHAKCKRSERERHPARPPENRSRPRIDTHVRW